MPQPVTQAELRALAQRNFDPAWLGVLEEGAAGQQLLALLERTWEYVARSAHAGLRLGLLVQTAPGAAPALSTVVLSRDMQQAEALFDMGMDLFVDGLPLPGTIPEGFALSDERGVAFVATDPVDTIVVSTGEAAGFSSITISRVESARTSPRADTPDGFIGGTIELPTALDIADERLIAPLSGNSREQRLAARRGITEYEATEVLRRWDALVEPFDPLLKTTSTVAAAGGTMALLDALARERGQARAPGELDDVLRARLLHIPDAVSPTALRDAVNAVSDRYGFRVTLLESLDDGTTAGGTLLSHITTTAYAPASTTPIGSSAVFFVDLAAAEVFADMVDDVLGWDGTPPMVPQAITFGTFYLDDAGSRLLSNREARGYFLLTAPLQNDPDPLRFFLDDGFADDPFFGFLDVVDHPVRLAQYLVISQEADARRAGGVRFDLILLRAPFTSP